LLTKSPILRVGFRIAVKKGAMVVVPFTNPLQKRLERQLKSFTPLFELSVLHLGPLIIEADPAIGQAVANRPPPSEIDRATLLDIGGRIGAAANQLGNAWQWAQMIELRELVKMKKSVGRKYWPLCQQIITFRPYEPFGEGIVCRPAQVELQNRRVTIELDECPIAPFKDWGQNEITKRICLVTGDQYHHYLGWSLLTARA
jgi:hypothetical protein